MSIVGKLGRQSISIPAGESIAVFTKGEASVYQVVGYPNVPDQDSLQATIFNQQTVVGPFTLASTVLIIAGAYEVEYEVGLSPIVQSRLPFIQGDPSAETTAATLTAEELLSRIITGTHTVGATAAYTLPTGTLMDESSEFTVGDSFDWNLMNLSAAAADTITVTAGTGHTIVGVAIVQSIHATTGGITGASSTWRTRKTAANTFVSYRVG